MEALYEGIRMEIAKGILRDSESNIRKEGGIAAKKTLKDM
jgi:hypothetical protein